MPWKFPSALIGGSQEQQASPHQHESPTQSWYPPPVVGSSNYSRPSTSSSSSGGAPQRASDWSQSPSKGLSSPAEAAGVISQLKNKSIDELKKLLADNNAYQAFFNSLEQVKIQSNLRDELQKETLQLARNNLEKEPLLMELRNQCRVIQTVELSAAQERLSELEKQKEETLRFHSSSSLLQKLEDARNKVEEESEAVHGQLLDKEIDLATFIQKYKKLRTIYHRRALVHLAAKSAHVG